MSIHYIDGIDGLRFQGGTIRGKLVVVENQISESSSDPDAIKEDINAIQVGTIITSLNGLLQIQASVNELVAKLIENNILKKTD
jgi:hypothetical protein